MNKLSELYKDSIVEMMKYAKRSTTVTVDDVYQEANKNILPFLDKAVSDHLLPGSEIKSFDNLKQLFELTKQGKKCIILVEHYSNFDLPVFSYLLRQNGEAGTEIDDNMISIAGIKMSESNPVITAFTEAYSRLVIYPSRSIDALEKTIKDPEILAKEIHKSNVINFASMKKLVELRSKGKLILVFPAGTRYRPWDPSTKRGVREIASYLRSFDYFCMISMNGIILEINKDGPMQEDILKKDKIIFDVSPVTKCSEFRAKVRENIPEDADVKQAVVDAAMQELDIMHEKIEKERII